MAVLEAILRRTELPPDAAAIARLGARLTALYRCWRSGHVVTQVTGELIAAAGLDDAAPLARTARAIASALAGWPGYPYHCAAHHAEVATNALVLVRLAHGQDGGGMLLCAALGHDLEFDPAQAATGRFAAEQHSAAATCAIAAAAGVAPEVCAALHLLILATEPLARAGLRTLLRHGTPPPEAPLRALAGRPDLLATAALLSDADMLSSSGLSIAWTRTQERLLAQERGRPASAADRQHYFERIMGADYLSPGGMMFMPNLERIRAAAG